MEILSPLQLKELAQEACLKNNANRIKEIFALLESAAKEGKYSVDVIEKENISCLTFFQNCGFRVFEKLDKISEYSISF